MKPGRAQCRAATKVPLTTPVQRLTFNPDGLSGGPNFAVHRTSTDFTVYFAGVTVRAGLDDLYIVKSGYIRNLMDAAIDIQTLPLVGAKHAMSHPLPHLTNDPASTRWRPPSVIES